MAMSLTAAGGGALAGVIVQEFGYPMLAAFAALLGAAVVAAGLATRRLAAAVSQSDVRPCGCTPTGWRRHG